MKDTALVLTGGGARSAYQVGVLKAISDILPDLHMPFPIICGASAGAINAVGLATTGDIFRHSVAKIEHLWSHLRTEDVFNADFWSLTRQGSSFIRSMLGSESSDGPSSMLDNAPLRPFLATHLDFDRMGMAIDQGDIKAVCVTACGYRSGQSVSFFQARESVEGWHLGQRLGVRSELTLDHLMASAAIPTIFPPVKINREYFGDGVLRNMATLSPAVHLGAKRILVIGVSANRVCMPERRANRKFPSTANVLEHMLNGAFIDVIENDIDKALLINQLLELIPEKKLEQSRISLRPLDMLVISPSQPFDALAEKHMKSLPFALRKVLGQNRKAAEGGASLASYLLFEGPFLRDLIKLGYQDAKDHAGQLQNFFSQDDGS